MDAQGQAWVYIPYLYGNEGWICGADPENATLPATAPQALAEKPEFSPQITTLPAIRPLAAANRAYLFFTIGAVAVVALGSAALLIVLARRKR